MPCHTLALRSCGPLILCRLLPFLCSFFRSFVHFFLFRLCCLVSIFSWHISPCPISVCAIVIKHATAVCFFVVINFISSFDWLCLSIACHLRVARSCCVLFVCRACRYIFGCILCVCVLFCMLNYFMFIVFISLRLVSAHISCDFNAKCVVHSRIRWLNGFWLTFSLGVSITHTHTLSLNRLHICI